MVNSKKNQGLLPFSTKSISFNFIDKTFSFRERNKHREWIILCLAKEKKELGELSYNFCSDKHLLGINKSYLNHDYYTDIITFDLSENPKTISGDIYISIDRVKENAKANNTTFHVELKRVMIHGILHLCGYKDKSKKDIAEMRKKEDLCLSLWRD